MANYYTNDEATVMAMLNGTQTVGVLVQRFRNSLQIPHCARMCRSASQGWSQRQTGSYGVLRCSIGTAAVTAVARTVVGRFHGVQNRLPIDFLSISLMIRQCEYLTRPSIKRSTFRDAGHCEGSLWRACGLAERYAFHGLEDVPAVRIS